MKANFVGIAIVALILSLHVQSVEAGFQSLYVIPTAGSTIPLPYYHANPSEGEIGIYETWSVEHGVEYGFEVHGETAAADSPPQLLDVIPLRITKEVTNATSLPWVGYNIDLDPSDPHTFELASPAPSSNVMTLTSGGPFSLEFGLPSPVNPGDSVIFDFVVNITTSGNFQFSLTQSPVAVPEPAACAMLLLGTVVGAAFYRRRS